ncbi:MAG: hypothetical protein LBH28_03530 [Oscillospiraceae bacterium]|nr:hypothetical protein [Oscillospiraceae bacterium]
MKKVILVSGIFTVLLLTLLLTGFADKDDGVKKAMRQGNTRYESAAYAEALPCYETGLVTDPENKTLNFNAAQAAYLLGEYEKAAEYYEKSEDSIEKYLNVGNMFSKLADYLQDDNEKLQCYLQALQIYHDGIILFPQNVPLKYNYESVKEKADELASNMEQENNDQNDGESDESQEQDNQNQDGSDEGQSQEQEGQNAEEDESAEQEQGDEQDGEQDSVQDSEQNGEQDNEQDSYSQEQDESELDEEAIERILGILESQEEESLKNNQEVIRGDNGKYGW